VSAGGLRSVCVYCGSRPGSAVAYAETARELAALLAARGIGVVYGGGKVGLMGIVAETVLAAGGAVTGVIPQVLADREVAHTGLTELRIVDSMHMRKQQMTELSDAFVILPGGIGTLDELIEAFTWTQLLIHDKPIALLNVRGYYDRLLAFLDHAVEEGFLSARQRATLIVEDEPEALLGALYAWYSEKRLLSNSSPWLLRILLWRGLIEQRWARSPARRPKLRITWRTSCHCTAAPPGRGCSVRSRSVWCCSPPAARARPELRRPTTTLATRHA
jgi:uncharacterized protein (TIGR00730 family)